MEQNPLIMNILLEGKPLLGIYYSNSGTHREALYELRSLLEAMAELPEEFKQELSPEMEALCCLRALEKRGGGLYGGNRDELARAKKNYPGEKFTTVKDALHGQAFFGSRARSVLEQEPHAELTVDMGTGMVTPPEYFRYESFGFLIPSLQHMGISPARFKRLHIPESPIRPECFCLLQLHEMIEVLERADPFFTWGGHFYELDGPMPDSTLAVS